MTATPCVNCHRRVQPWAAEMGWSECAACALTDVALCQECGEMARFDVERAERRWTHARVRAAGVRRRSNLSTEDPVYWGALDVAWDALHRGDVLLLPRGWAVTGHAPEDGTPIVLCGPCQRSEIRRLAVAG